MALVVGCAHFKMYVPEVNISSYPATDVAGSFFFSSCRNIKFRGFCAEIFRSGGFVQKYWSVIAARYCYELSSHAPRLFGFDQTKPSCSAVPKNTK